MKKALPLFFGVLLVFLPAVSRAHDFGLVLDQSGGYLAVGESGNWDYTGVLLPRYSGLLGDNGTFYVSAGVVAAYGNAKWSVMPELLRTEVWLLNLANLSAMDLRIGRLYYSDPLGIIADGLFDGLRLTYDTPVGSFSAGAWYTGLLYKSRARIAMTPEELLSYREDVAYSDFFNTYFAPRRLVSALDYEHPGLGGLLRTRTSLLAQFDLEGTRLHSQYLTAKAELPLGAFLFNLGGSFELKEVSAEMGTAFAAEAGGSWTLPAAITSRISLLARYSSGEMGGGVGAFLPLTAKSQSSILQPKIPGTSMIYLDYVARLHRTVSISLSSSYFIRNDLETYTGYPVSGAEGEDGLLLGNEFFGRLYWSPFSDMQLTLGGGAFVPGLGNVAPKIDNIWRVEAGLVISLY
jgi:hypothetical protein